MNKKRILIVEDDMAIQRLLSMMLNAYGYDISSAEHGLKAIEILHKESFDIIICDMMMPFMDGLRFLKWLRNEFKADIPVIVLTSVHDPKIREDMLKAGATDVIYKPVAMQELTRRLEGL
ncbi:MAG: response regulator [Thermodesulfovibrionia bacterium]